MPVHSMSGKDVHGAYVRKNCLRVLNNPGLLAKRMLQAKLDRGM